MCGCKMAKTYKQRGLSLINNCCFNTQKPLPRGGGFFYAVRYTQAVAAVYEVCSPCAVFPLRFRIKAATRLTSKPTGKISM